MNEETLSNLDSDEIEEIEKLTLRWVFQAVLDFGMEAHEVFLKSPDNVKDIAEDITRELLDRLPGFIVKSKNKLTFQRVAVPSHPRWRGL